MTFIAEFKSLESKYDWNYYFERDESDLDRPVSGMVRVSEWVNVTFPPRPAEDVVPDQLAALDREQQKLVAEHLAQLQKIAEQRAKLLALTHQPKPFFSGPEHSANWDGIQCAVEGIGK